MPIQRPEGAESTPRDYTMADLTDEQLVQGAMQTFNLKTRRLFSSEATSCIRPVSLKARYTEGEIDILDRELSGGLYEIGDLTGSVLREIRDYLAPIFAPYGYKPFDMSLGCSHLGKTGEEAVESTPANIAEIHGEKFGSDLITFALLEYIKARATTKPASDALQLEIPAEVKPETLQAINARLSDFSSYGYNSKIVRPTLSMALQSAVQRNSVPHNLREAITVTDEKGPGGIFLAVISKPGHPIVLRECRENAQPPVVNGSIVISNHYLVRELLPRPGADEDPDQILS